jgi:penicillin-binding protein 2
VRVPAPRGKILDRNGIALAENRASYSISLYLEDRSWRDAVQKEYKRAEQLARNSAPVPRKPKFIEKILSWFGYKPALTQPRRLNTAEKAGIGRNARYSVTSNIVWQLGVALRQPLTVDETKFHRHYDRRRALPLPIIPNLNLDQIARFQEQSVHLPGVDMEMQPMRVYPYSELAAQVVGCLTHFDDASAEGELASFNYHLPDYRGYDGIEASYDAQLRGKAGAKSVLVNNLGYRQNETILSPIEAGKNVTLTIDAEIQRGAAKPVRGAAVVLDVRTGEIVALASAPGFNPNNWIPGLPTEIWNTYTNEDFAPLQNKAVFGNYAPGSIFKIVVAFAGLEGGTLDPNEILTVEPNPSDHAHGAFVAGRRLFKDTAPPGDYSLKRALARSSNSYFIQQGLRMDPQRIVMMAQRFHLGEKTGLPLRESRGNLPTQFARASRSGHSGIAIANMCIGQGDLDVTPLQLAAMVAAVANGGKILQPQLVLRTAAPDELLAEPPVVHAVVRENIYLNERNLGLVREAMLADTEDAEWGTAFTAFHERDKKTPVLKNFRVGGKTGTAQVEKNGKFDHYTVWFASYAPFESPRYAVVVMVDHGSSGGGTCAPVATKIYRALESRESRTPMTRKDSFARN